MFCLAILRSLCLGNTIFFSGSSLSTLNFFGNVSGDPTSKNEIFYTGHHFAEFFKNYFARSYFGSIIFADPNNPTYLAWPALLI